MPRQIVNPFLLDGKNAAKALGISYKHFRATGMPHKIPRVRIGKRDMFPVSGLLKWIKENEINI